MELNGWSPWIHLLIPILFTTVGAQCPESGSCETCDLRMSANLMSVNNVIMVIQQQEITFTLNFQQREHSGFAFKVNGENFDMYSKDPDFMCISESDVVDVTETLQVQYHCTAVTPGSYRIEAQVYYCDRDYFAQTLTVIVQNDVSTPSALTPMLSLSASLTVLPPMTSALISSLNPSPSVMMSKIAPSTSSSRILSSASVSVSPSSTAVSNNHHEDLPTPPASLPSLPSSTSVSASPVPSMSSSLALSSVPVPSPSIIMPVTVSTLSPRVLPSISASVSPSSTTENDDLPTPPASLPSSPSSSSSVSASLTSISPVLVPSVSSSLALSSVPSTRSSVPSLSIVMPVTPSSALPTSTTENDDTMIAVMIIMCAFVGLILIGVIVIIIIILKYPKARPKNVCQRWSDQPAPDPPDANIYHNKASGSNVAPSDFSTLVDSVSVSFAHPEQIEMSENVTQDPDEAITSHQLGTNCYTN